MVSCGISAPAATVPPEPAVIAGLVTPRASVRADPTASLRRPGDPVVAGAPGWAYVTWMTEQATAAAWCLRSRLHAPRSGTGSLLNRLHCDPIRFGLSSTTAPFLRQPC